MAITNQLIKRPLITASNEVWQAFLNWSDAHGYQSLSEAFRAAMIEVTQFKPLSQDKNVNLGKPVSVGSEKKNVNIEAA